MPHYFFAASRRAVSLRVLARCGALLLTLCCAPRVLAQGVAVTAAPSGPIAMEVGSPFFINDKSPSLVIKNARWFPVAVTLSNSGDEVSGRVTLRLTDSSQQGDRSATFYSDVKLPAKAARKRVWVYGRADGDNAFDGAEVSFEGGGFTMLRQKLGLIVPELGQRLILTISDSGEKLGFLSSLSDEKMAKPDGTRGLPENQRRLFRDVRIKPTPSARSTRRAIWCPTVSSASNPPTR